MSTGSLASFDLLLSEPGLVTTVAGQGVGEVVSIPVAGGMAPGRVWPVAVTPGLGEALAGMAGSRGATGRAVAVLGLVAEAMRAAEGPVVPTPSGDGWAWRAVLEPEGRARADRARRACVDAGVVVADDPAGRVARFFDDVVTARVGAGLAQGESLGLLASTGAGAGRSAAERWARHVVARAGVGARLALRLDPPESLEQIGAAQGSSAEDGSSQMGRWGAEEPDVPRDGSGSASRVEEPSDGPGRVWGPRWQVTAIAVHLAEATTRLPLATAAPSTFGADPDAWWAWREVEAEMLGRAWGSGRPDWLEDVAGGASAALDATEVLALVDRAERLVAGGFDVLAPGGLLRRASVGRRMRSVGTGAGTLRIDALGLSAEVSVDGEPLTAEDLATLAAAKSELVSVRGRWVRLDAEDARRLGLLARRAARQVSAADLLTDEAFEGVEFDAAEVLPRGLRPARQLAPPVGVRAQLRPYQLRGFQWLSWLADNEVGGVLADDMGLGKTLQVLTWVAADHPGPTLVVCPVTLVDTWARQAAQFTPGLRVRTFHGSLRGSIVDVVDSADIVVTTYGLLAREATLQEVDWHRVVLDEAQAVKNPDTRAARAARALPARHRLVVTGTPVENHLGDLWSLMAIAHPGLLPRRTAFQKAYASGAADPARLGALRAVIGPFVLRRVKTDPGILPDLPDREVIRDDCTLTREQVGAYEAVVADMLGALAQMRAEAAQRGAAETRGASVGPPPVELVEARGAGPAPVELVETRGAVPAPVGRVETRGGASEVGPPAVELVEARGSGPAPVELVETRGSGPAPVELVETRGAEGGSPGVPDLTRRAAVLAGLARLKQICVHPALLTESRRGLGARGGKVNRLVELCGQIIDEGQAVVVFTQFASFVPDLAEHLSEALSVEVATLTGADSRTRRAQTVAQFSEPDGPPILIASLKAGGTGLTLVRANHVIHLDRWWNPAVEDQASDRVWRIGQNQKVFVHVLVCPGTLEERIDEALAAKRTVAASVVRATETAITELSDDDLASLVGLVRSQVLE